MSKGWIGGTVWGVLAAGLSLVAVSQIAPLPERAAPPTAVPEIAPASVEPAGPPVTVVPPDISADTAGAATPVEAPERTEPADPAPAEIAAAPKPAPSVAEAAPGRETIANARQADVPGSEIAEPLAQVADAGSETPEAGAKFVSVETPAAEAQAAPQTPPSPVPPTVVADAPERVAASAVPVGQTVLPSVLPAPVASARPAAAIVGGPVPTAPVLPVQQGPTTAVIIAAPSAVTPAVPAVTTPAAPSATARAEFQPGLIGPVEAPAADVPPVAGSLPPPPPLTPEEAAILADIVPLPDANPAEDGPEVIILTESAEPTKPSILKKPPPLASAPSLPAKGQVPTTDALPVVDPADSDAAATPPAEPVVTLPDNAPPIDRFARPFDNAAGKPLFAVVLIDTGGPQLDREALAAMPFPVTFALDPTVPEAALAASIYRAAGQEVVMLATGIPEGATASDVEVSFAAHQAALPEAVAVLDLEAGGFQSNRPLATLVVPVLAGQGRGLLSWDRGLNAASQIARREGLRSGVIFRRLDGEAEPVAQMRRYLDRAAFKAAQDGHVIVAGETRPDTVRALLEWAVEGRASTVALAPLTAALRAE